MQTDGETVAERERETETAAAGSARGPRADEPRTLVADRVYGAVGVLAVLLALFFLVRGGPSDGAQNAAADGVPALVILSPAPGAETAQPLAVEFDAGARLTLDPAGWSAGGRHVHIRAGTTELMAAGGDVEPLGNNRYRWTLPPLPPGEHTLQLLWSDERHRAVSEGASRPVTVRVR